MKHRLSCFVLALTSFLRTTDQDEEGGNGYGTPIDYSRVPEQIYSEARG